MPSAAEERGLALVQLSRGITGVTAEERGLALMLPLPTVPPKVPERELRPLPPYEDRGDPNGGDGVTSAPGAKAEADVETEVGDAAADNFALPLKCTASLGRWESLPNFDRRPPPPPLENDPPPDEVL